MEGRKKSDQIKCCLSVQERQLRTMAAGRVPEPIQLDAVLALSSVVIALEQGTGPPLNLPHRLLWGLNVSIDVKSSE